MPKDESFATCELPVEQYLQETLGSVTAVPRWGTCRCWQQCFSTSELSSGGVHLAVFSAISAALIASGEAPLR